MLGNSTENGTFRIEFQREKKNDNDDRTLFGAVEPDLKILVPEQDRVALDERIGAQHLRHAVQLVSFADVIDFTCGKKQQTIQTFWNIAKVRRRKNANLCRWRRVLRSRGSSVSWR